MDSTETETRSPRRRRRRTQTLDTRELRALACDALLAIVLVGSALAIGTVHIPVLLAISGLALTGATVEAWGLKRVPWPAVVLAALGLFSALQAVPLPAAWVSWASPVSASVWLRSLIPFGEPPLHNFSLSLDPSASIAEALKWLTYASVYIMAVRSRSRRGSTWLATLLFGSVTLVALTTLIHGIADLTEVYGIYQPNFPVRRWSVGPLLNSNNLAGYAILGLFAGGGLLLSGRSSVPRLGLMIGLGAISAVLALSGSRAGVLSTLVAGFVAVIWQLTASGSRNLVRGLGLAMAPLAMGITIAFALGTDQEAEQLVSLDFSRKVLVWLWSLPMIREHALVGVGRGSFETAFPAYRQALDYDWAIVVTHAENFVIQWISEWGIPVGVGAVVLIVGYLLREWYRTRDNRLHCMLLTGVLALFFQNFADLGLEVPALAIAAVVALAAGERSLPARSTEISSGTEAAKPLGKRAFVVAVPALALWVAASAWSRSPVELERSQMSAEYGELAILGPGALANESADERALHSLLEPVTAMPEVASVGRTDDVARFRDHLHQATLRHPGEAFFPLLGSLVAMRKRDGTALTWLGRALELSPANGSVHLVLADLMHRHGAMAQAMLHLRLAAQYDHTLSGAVSARAPVWASSVETLMQAIPDGSYGQDLLLAACIREPQVVLKLDCLRRAAQRNPNAYRVQMDFAEALLQATQARQPPCNDALAEGCTAEADGAIRAARGLDPKAWRPNYLLSKVLRVRGDSVGAARLLTRTCPQSLDGEECWQEALATAIKSGSMDAISAAADALAARECDGMESCAKMFASIASALESGSQLALASKFYIKAAEAEPSAARWLKVAELAAQAHLDGVARAALDRANRSFDASPTTRAHVELLRQRVARNAPESP
ncbi:MAG TPA: O-antigen ligase family protein [Polyangiaceae bacterium]|nr:O-antigen ligase family protein [Polyangiaceae bacterium]